MFVEHHGNCLDRALDDFVFHSKRGDLGAIGGNVKGDAGSASDVVGNVSLIDCKKRRKYRNAGERRGVEKKKSDTGEFF